MGALALGISVDPFMELVDHSAFRDCACEIRFAGEVVNPQLYARRGPI